MIRSLYVKLLLSAMLVVGLLTVIARIVYLASRPPAQATAVAGAAAGSAPGAGLLPLQPEALLELPADASVKALSLSGERLAVQYISPRGDGIAVLDLTTGRVVSRVKLAPAAR